MEKKEFAWIATGFVAIVVMVLFICSYHVTDAGYRSVPTTFGTVGETPYENGFSLTNPFTVMHDMNVQTQVVKDQTNTYTADVQTAAIDYTFTYNLKPSSVCILYKEVGTDYIPKKITPVLNDALKDVIGKYQAQELVSYREQAREKVVLALKEKLDQRFFENITFQILDLNYSDNFEKAIEEKVTAEQNALKAVNNTRRIQEEAQQKIITAKAEAEAMEIKAQALAKNKSLVEYEAVLKRDGKLPNYMFGNSTPFINVGGGK